LGSGFWNLQGSILKTGLRVWLSDGTLSSVPQKRNGNQALVAHTCNPSYLGGRDQEDHGLRPARAKKKKTTKNKQKKSQTLSQNYPT
jgi:hypothetical protein